MQSEDLRVALGLSSYKSHLQWNSKRKFESEQKMELFLTFAKGTVSAYLIRILEFRKNSNLTRK